MPAIPPPYVDYVPASDGDFATWSIAFSNGYTASGLLVPDAIAVGAAVLDFGTKLGAATSGATRGPSTIAAKDASRATAEGLCRLGAQAMVQAYNNGDLTSQDLVDSGVRVPSAVQTPRLPPDLGPELVLRKIEPGQVFFTVQISDAAGSKKPIGVVGAEIFRGVWSGDPATPPTEFDYVQMSTRKRAIVDTVGFEGQNCRYKARWVTVRGAQSPYGAMIDAYGA
jgi:hypothetical protein